MEEQNLILELFLKLTESEEYFFPEKGRVSVTDKKGVYIIYDNDKNPLHVGSTPRAKKGINQRLYQHLTGASSFNDKFLKPNKINLRKNHTFKFIELDNSPRTRVLLESYTIGKLCPKHLGTSV